MREVYRLGVFQKFNGWLNDRGGKSARGGTAAGIPGGAYYASQEAEQAYGGMRKPVQETPTMAESMAAGSMTGRSQPVDRFSADQTDKYAGRVPYRSQKDMQAESDAQRQQAEEQQRRQQAAFSQQKAQQFGRPTAQSAQGAPGYSQPSNVVPFPGMVRGPEGNYYAHVEYVVLLRSRNECTKVIEFIKSNASVFLNMEFIANDSERQRCVDMLSGAAYTLGCDLNKISQRGIYLISSPSVRVVIDPALQKYASAPEAQGYVRPEYASPATYGAQAGYAAAPRPAYGAQQPMAQPMGQRAAAYTGAQAVGYGGAATGPYAAQPGAGTRTPAYGTAQPNAYTAAQSAAYGGAATGPYAAQQPAGPRTAAYGAAQPAAFGAGAATGPYAVQQPVAQGRRAGAPFGMQGAFVRSADGSQGR